MLLRLVKIIAGVLVFGMVSLKAYAEPTAGSCQGFQFPANPYEKSDIIDTNIPVRVLRQNVPVYSKAEGSTIITSLDFDTDLVPIRQTSNRVLVRKQRHSTDLGWIEKPELLCQIQQPLMKNGLPRKVFIKLAADTDAFQAPVYSSPDRNQCPPCEPISSLSRFDAYFVFSEDSANRRYLLAGGYILNGSYKRFPLVGWIDEDRIIPWNTGLGLRPKNDSQFSEEAQTILAYDTVADSQKHNKSKSIELQTGNIWYQFPLHIPLLDIVDGHYHVVAPAVGMKGFKTFNPGMDAMKRVDVFFVLDGTANKAAYLEPLKRVVDEMVYNLNSDLKETTFRFGFLVYRDDAANQRPMDTECQGPSCEKLCENGLCETKRLENTDCHANDLMAEESGDRFIEEIAKIKATSDEREQYSVHLFDGLTAAFSEISSCSDNTKLVFVIGEHGDQSEPISEQEINRLIRPIDKLGVFFIQIPKDELKANSSAAYQAAYQQFGKQAVDVIAKVYSQSNQPAASHPEQHLLSLTDANELTARIVDTIKAFSSSVVVNEIEQILLNGESVTEAIRKYRNKEAFSDLYWQWMKKSLCDQMGEQCENTVNHKVKDFYIPIQPDQMQVEVVLIERHLDLWIKLLRPLVILGGGMTGTKKKEQLVTLHQDAIQRILGNPPIEITEPITLANVLQQSKQALPINLQTPLLQYTVEELLQLDGCEMQRLIDRLRMSRSLLTKAVANPTLGVSYTQENYHNSECRLTDKGKKIKRMRFGARHKLGEDDSYRYGHVFKGITLYWLPAEFLP